MKIPFLFRCLPVIENIILDTEKNFFYTVPMLHSNPLIVKRVLKGAWHINAVAGEYSINC